VLVQVQTARIQVFSKPSQVEKASQSGRQTSQSIMYYGQVDSFFVIACVIYVKKACLSKKSVSRV